MKVGHFQEMGYRISLHEQLFSSSNNLHVKYCDTYSTSFSFLPWRDKNCFSQE